jgi:hypothetical protein
MRAPAQTSFLFAVTLLGISQSFQATPILGALATAIGSRQIGGQATNASVQRFGALLGAFFLTRMDAAGNGLGAAYAALLLGAAALMAVSFAVPRLPSKGDEVGIQRGLKARASAASVWKAGEIRRAMAASLVTLVAVIFGASILPLLLIRADTGNLVVPILVGRELFAIAAAQIAGRCTSRAGLTKWFAVCVAATVFGCLVFTVSPPHVGVLAMSLHGTVIGAGIVYGNYALYEATTLNDRYFAFAAASITGRITSLMLPAVLGVVLQVSSPATIILFSLSLVLLSCYGLTGPRRIPT